MSALCVDKLIVQEVAKDHEGCYAKVHVVAHDGELTIRWGLDDDTYYHLAQAMRTLRIIRRGATPASVALSTAFTPAGDAYQCTLTCATVPQRFLASHLFVANLAWVGEVTSIEDVRALEWRRFEQPFKQHEAELAIPSEALSQRPVNPPRKSIPTLQQRRAARTRRTRVERWFATAIAVAVVTVGAFSLTNGHGVTAFASLFHRSTARSDTLPLVPPKAKSTTTNSAGLAAVKPTGAIPVATTVAGPEMKYQLKNHVPAVYGVSPGYVALTFDDGPSQYTEQILAILQRYHINATFFFIGIRVEQWHEAVQDTVQQGNAVGNHSWSHPLFTDLTPDEEAKQVSRAEQELQKYVPTPVELFRPPYGSYDSGTTDALEADKMVMALWNRDPRDWDAANKAQIVDAVLGSHPSGGVYDFHEEKLTVEALPTIIEALQKQGLHFAVLSAPTTAQ